MQAGQLTSRTELDLDDPGCDGGAVGLEPGWLPSASPLLSEVSIPAQYMVSFSLNEM